MSDIELELTKPGILKSIAKRIKDDIDDFCADVYDDGPRTHLGASLIGHPCKMYLWLVFRWAYHKKHSGRQQRLFNRGHREEDRFVEWLKGIGCQIWTFDESNLNEENKGARQFRISACKGHFGGSLDAIVRLPERYGLPDLVLLGEFKTNGTGKKFTDLCKNGVMLEKPQHFAQKSIYGYKYGFQYGVYLNICKNDDELHVEVVKLDWELAKFLEQKAEEIIFAEEPPSKMSASPTYYECKWCDMHLICHCGAPIDVNCRSCRNAKAVENAEWFCSHHNAIIPKDYIKQACSEWKGVI